MKQILGPLPYATIGRDAFDRANLRCVMLHAEYLKSNLWRPTRNRDTSAGQQVVLVDVYTP